MTLTVTIGGAGLRHRHQQSQRELPLSRNLQRRLCTGHHRRLDCHTRCRFDLRRLERRLQWDGLLSVVMDVRIGR